MIGSSKGSEGGRKSNEGVEWGGRGGEALKESEGLGIGQAVKKTEGGDG